MKQLKVFIIIGTRPELIKMAPIIRLMQADARFMPQVVSTAQHREMLDELLQLFAIRPDYDLNIMSSNQSLCQVAQKSLVGLSELIERDTPDMVLVEGDTTTAFMGALAAFYNKVPVGHVEAGLRTDNKYNPFPEEINRRLITKLADLHFSPTSSNTTTLLAEGIPAEHIFQTGNPIIDSIIWMSNSSRSSCAGLDERILNSDKRVILVTAHRRENWGAPLSNICNALKKISEKNEDIVIVYPVHPHPQVRNVVFPILQGLAGTKLLEPLPYDSFAMLMHRAYFIITDSGGIQEEATALGKPVLVIRENTERMEAVNAGIARLVGTTYDMIVEAAQTLLNDRQEYDKMANKQDLFGDGTASKQILEAVASYFSA